MNQKNNLIAIADALSEASLAVQALEQVTELFGTEQIDADLALWMIWKSIESINQSLTVMKDSVTTAR